MSSPICENNVKLKIKNTVRSRTASENVISMQVGGDPDSDSGQTADLP